MKKYESIKLYTGSEMPMVGMGTMMLDMKGNMQEIVDNAIEAGFRMFDNAALYGNEIPLGAALKKNGIPREELFITNKLKNGHHQFDDAVNECKKSLKNLGIDYLDLYLIHYPCPEHGMYKEAWKALEHLNKEGYVKNIGVSNFYIHHLEDLLPTCEIMPAIDQFECNPYCTMEPLREYLKERHIQPEAWFPLGGPVDRIKGEYDSTKNLYAEPVILAAAENHGKTPAQILLRWGVQNGLIVIPKSANPVHIKENIDIFNFALSDAEMNKINGLNEDYHGAPTGDNNNEYWD